MKYYFYSAGLILFAVIIAVTVPFLLHFVDNITIDLQIPQNNSAVAGVQKYNIPPIAHNLPVPSFPILPPMKYYFKKMPIFHYQLHLLLKL